MKYKLICNGRLSEGADLQRAIQALLKVTRLTEERAKVVCSSGRQISLGSTEDKARADKMCLFLRNAGIEVEVIADVPQHTQSESKSNRPPPAKQKPLNSNRGRPRALIAVAALLVVILISIAGYGWYWLYMTESPDLIKAEQAVADGHLVAVAYIDVDKAVLLSENVFGAPDPAALPGADNNSKLLNKLFSGPADFKHNLKQALFAIHVNPEDQKADSTLFLSGNFDARVILSELRRDYVVTSLGANQWELKDKPKTTPTGSTAADSADCGNNNAQPMARHKNALPLRLRITPGWLMLSHDAAYTDKLWQRLESGTSAGQDLQRWRTYRQGNLAALMVFVPEKAAQGINGMPGMMAQGAVRQMPDVNVIAAAAEVDIPARGLDLDFSLFSQNVQWNSETADKIRKRLDKMQADSRSVSPTFARLFSRVSLHDSKEKLAVNVALNADLLGDINTKMQEGLSNLLTPTVSMRGNKGPQAEQIDQHPTDYSLYQGLTKLPDLRTDQFHSTSLFGDGSFAVDVKSISFNKEKGFFQVDSEARVAMPSGKTFMSHRPEKLVFTVDSVKTSDGRELMRDEHCMSRKELFGTRNNEPETNFNTSNDEAYLTKRTRLKPGTRPGDIATINGTFSLAVPTAVSKFTVPLKVGETIEHAGMRFYLSSVKDDSVTYQVSGQDNKLLEVRALNKQGMPLSSSWSMSETQGPSRVTQAFRGRVEGLEIYIADKFLRVDKSFELHDILSTPDKKKKAEKPAFLTPRHVKVSDWKRYAGHDLKKLKVNPMEWMVSGKDRNPVAEIQWSTAKMYVTHTPQKWGNSPQVHLYYPMLKGLPGDLSALSSEVLIPAAKAKKADAGSTEVFHRVFYPYQSNSGEIFVKHKLDGLAMAQQTFTLSTGLAENEKLKRLKGNLIFRLPLSLQSTRLSLDELWAGKEVDGIRVTLTGIDRGMFPGYKLKIEGGIYKLVNVRELTTDGKHIMADPINFQTDGYWTMTLPFNQGIKAIELITAKKQKVIKLPFDLKPVYTAKK